MTDSQNGSPKPPSGPHNEGPEQMPGMSPSLQPNLLDQKELKKAQRLVMVASIAGPVSLFIGGVFLGTVGLVCGIMAYRKLKQLAAKRTEVGVFASRLKRSSIIGMCVCGVAIVLNGIYAYIMFPTMLEMLESGDYAGLAGDAGSSAGPSATWG